MKVKRFQHKFLLVSIIFFLALITLLPRLYKINTPLADWHSWRQADTASVTRYLIKDNFNVLQPRYHDISRIQTGYENFEGYRFVEFPIFNIIHAGIYSISGLSLEVSGRLVSIVAAIFTTIALFLIGRKMSNLWAGFFAGVFYAILPFNVYFTRVILPDPLSVSFAIWGVYLFYEFSDNSKNKYLFASAISFSLALLVKPFAVFFAVPIIFLTFKKYGIKKLFTNIPLLVALNIALIPMLLWRGWMQQPELLRGIPHFGWLFNGDGIRFKPSFWMWIFGERIGKQILGYWGLILFGAGVFSSKSKNILIWLLSGSLLYLVILATANVKHDYYQTFIIPPIALAMGHGVYTIFSKRYLNKIYAGILILFIVSLNLLLSFYWIRGNYKINDLNMLAAAARMQEISEEDDLIIAPYNGNSVFLYHTGRRGWTVITTNIDQMIGWGAKYYVSTTKNDTDTKNFKNRFQLVEETDQYTILRLENKVEILN